MTKKIHQLAAEAFLGPCPKGYEVDHVNGKKEDNRVSNYEYVTPKVNTRRAWALGLCSSREGERNQSARLSEAQVHQIRKQREAGETLHALARKFGTTFGNVHKIVVRRTWKHLKEKA